MKIAVLFEFPDPQIGGAYSFVTKLVKNIETNSSNYSHDFIFMNSNSSAEFYSDTHQFLNLPPVKTPFKSRILIKILKHFGVRADYQDIDSSRHPWDKIFKQWGVDFVWSLMPVRRPFSTPFATTIWDLDHLTQPFFPEFSNGGEWESREKDMEYSIKTAALVITGTDYTGQLLSRKYGVDDSRIVISPFAIHPHKSSDMTRDNNLIFYPAQFWAHKNHINLIRAIRILVDAGAVDLKLLLSGSDKGNQNFVLQEVKNLSLENHVKFLGFLDGDVVERLYQSVGIVVFPSFCGPDNLPPLEAISHSVTAAISDLPGLKEQWGEAFYYFDPDSPSSIANSIRVGLRFGITEQMAETRGILEQNLSPSRSIEIVIGRIDRIAPRIANISP